MLVPEARWFAVQVCVYLLIIFFLSLAGFVFQRLCKVFSILLVKYDIDIRTGHGSGHVWINIVKSLPVSASLAIFGPSGVSMLSAVFFVCCFAYLQLTHNTSLLERYLNKLIPIRPN